MGYDEQAQILSNSAEALLGMGGWEERERKTGREGEGEGQRERKKHFHFGLFPNVCVS